MATLTLQNWHADDDGTPRANKTVVYKAASDAEPNANPVLGTTTTNASGKWQFTGVADGDYDVYLTDGVTVRFWKGLAALPLTFARAPVGPVTNALVNGDFNVAQRGTSFPAAVSGAYTLDRWLWGAVGAGVVTITRDTDVPPVGANAINTPYSLKVDVTTADAAIAATDIYHVFTAIEGFDYRPLTNGFAISFWVKAAKTGIHCVAFRNRGLDRSWVAEYTVSAANTWEYKTLVVTTPPTAGTWDYATGLGLFVSFVLAAGSNFQGTAGAWQSSNLLASSGQVNELDNTANDFKLALVNLIPGSTAAPLVPLPYEVQLARCQRYCQVYGGAATLEIVATGTATTTTNAFMYKPLVAPMRDAPSLTVSAVGDWSVSSGGIAACTALAITANSASPHAVQLTAAVAAGLTVGQAYNLLASTTLNARLTFESNPA